MKPNNVLQPITRTDRAPAEHDVRAQGMTDANSLLTTYHKRKVQITLGVVAVCGMAAVLFALSSASNAGLYGNIAALVVFLVIFWLGYVVTFPQCNLRLLFHAMSGQSAGNWLHWASHVSECPRCGHVAKVKQ